MTTPEHEARAALQGLLTPCRAVRHDRTTCLRCRALWDIEHGTTIGRRVIEVAIRALAVAKTCGTCGHDGACGIQKATVAPGLMLGPGGCSEAWRPRAEGP